MTEEERREKRKIYNRTYYLRHLEIQREKHRLYQRAHKEKAYQNTQKWQAEHPETRKSQSRIAWIKKRLEALSIPEIREYYTHELQQEMKHHDTVKKQDDLKKGELSHDRQRL